MREFSIKEKRIIELIQQSDKSFTELRDSGEDLLRSDATLNRLLKNLKRMNYIESYPVNEPNTRIKKRYRLTKNYHDEREAEGKNIQISKMIKTRLNWQNVFDNLINFLELEYPIFFQNPDVIEAKDVYSDIFSYLIFFNIDYEILKDNSKLYFELMLYLILHHPDEKYKSIQKEFEFNPIEYKNIINDFKNMNKLEEFVFRHELNSQEIINYLISDDPILYFIRQQVDTYFFKFLLCWQFPGVFLEDHFDLIFNFSHQIYQDLMNKFISGSNKSLLRFLKQNRICILNYAREYILEFLNKIKIETATTDTKYPLELLPRQQKEDYIAELILSPEILTRVEKRYLENNIIFLGPSDPEKIDLVKDMIIRVIEKIEELSIVDYKKEEVLSLKSRLLILIRIFYQSDKKLYRKFKKEYNSKIGQKKISYSLISKDLFTGIKELLLDLDFKREDIKKKFMIRQFLERIDHISNKIKNKSEAKEIFYQEISEIFNIVSKILSEKSQYPFYKKKCDLFFKDIKIIKESDVISIINKLKKIYPRNSEVQYLIFNYFKKTKNSEIVNKIIVNNEWSLKDKILLFERYVIDISSDFNLFEYFNLNTDLIQELLKSSLEEDSKLIIKLLKSIGFILEERGSIFDAFFVYYFACILEQDIFFDPLKRGYMFEYMPFYDFSLKHFRLYAPAYLNLMRMSQQYSDELFMSNEFKEGITKIISNNIHKIENNEKIDTYIDSFPALIENFLIISEFFDLDSDFKDVISAIRNHKELDLSKTKIREIKTIKDLSKEEKEKLLLIRENLDVFNKKVNNLDFLLTVYNIDQFLEELYERSLKNILPSSEYSTDSLSKLISSQMEYGIDKFPELAKLSTYNLFPIDFQFYTRNIMSKNYNLQLYNIYNFNRNIIIEKEKTDFELIENAFGIKSESSDYPFKLAFARKYVFPEFKEVTFWEDLIHELKYDEFQLIELLDLYIYHSRFFVSFDYLEKVVFLIFKKYGLMRAIRYIDCFYNYIIWYNKRIKNPITNIIPYTLGEDIILSIIDFCFNTIKAKIHWEYRDRNETQNEVTLANKYLKKVADKSENLFGLTSVIKCKEDLNELKQKLLL